MEEDKERQVKANFTLNDVKGMVSQIQKLSAETGIQTQYRVAGQYSFANLGMTLVYGSSGCNLTCEGCTGCSGCTGCDDTSSSSMKIDPVTPWFMNPDFFKVVTTAMTGKK